MVQTIVNMAKAMRLNIVAEGIEDLDTANCLRDMGVNHLQGFYFSKPKPPEECLLLMKNMPTKTTPASDMEPALKASASR